MSTRCAAGSETLEFTPYVRRIVQDRTVRLVATARLRDPVLRKLVEQTDLAALEEIEGATSGRLRAQEAGTERLDRRELVYGLAHAHFINAAFAYFMPRRLNRFNGPAAARGMR